MVMISVTVYPLLQLATSLRATISGLKFVGIGQNRATSALLSGLKFKKIAKNRGISSLFSALEFVRRKFLFETDLLRGNKNCVEIFKKHLISKTF